VIPNIKERCRAIVPSRDTVQKVRRWRSIDIGKEVGIVAEVNLKFREEGSAKWLTDTGVVCCRGPLAKLKTLL